MENSPQNQTFARISPGMKKPSPIDPKQTARKSAFTLIEMLIVIAIISLLMSLLALAVKNARDMAKGITCMNNIRQGLLALSIYAGDNGGSYPTWRTEGGEYWSTRLILGKYLPATTSGMPSVLVCPSEQPKVYLATHLTYGLWTGDAHSNPGTFISTSDIESNGASTVVLADSARFEYNATWTQSFYIQKEALAELTASSKTIHLRHRGRGNVGFGDGSVRSAEPADLERLGWGYKK
ncbi:MAG: type II secretion system protein [Verrucomicrobiae bacterium]|nr:type II secretion system protein [Verrucomicrobiae bacterium]